MEKGKTYEVYYQDDSQTRHKTMVFEDVQDGIIKFTNSHNQSEEFIPVNRIIRIQGERKNDKRQDNDFSK